METATNDLNAILNGPQKHNLVFNVHFNACSERHSSPNGGHGLQACTCCAIHAPAVHHGPAFLDGYGAVSPFHEANDGSFASPNAEDAYAEQEIDRHIQADLQAHWNQRAAAHDAPTFRDGGMLLQEATAYNRVPHGFPEYTTAPSSPSSPGYVPLGPENANDDGDYSQRSFVGPMEFGTPHSARSEAWRNWTGEENERHREYGMGLQAREDRAREREGTGSIPIPEAPATRSAPLPATETSAAPPNGNIYEHLPLPQHRQAEARDSSSATPLHGQIPDIVKSELKGINDKRRVPLGRDECAQAITDVAKEFTSEQLARFAFLVHSHRGWQKALMSRLHIRKVQLSDEDHDLLVDVREAITHALDEVEKASRAVSRRRRSASRGRQSALAVPGERGRQQRAASLPDTTDVSVSSGISNQNRRTFAPVMGNVSLPPRNARSIGSTEDSPSVRISYSSRDPSTLRSRRAEQPSPPRREPPLGGYAMAPPAPAGIQSPRDHDAPYTSVPNGMHPTSPAPNPTDVYQPGHSMYPPGWYPQPNVFPPWPWGPTMTSSSPYVPSPYSFPPPPAPSWPQPAHEQPRLRRDARTVSRPLSSPSATSSSNRTSAALSSLNLASRRTSPSSTEANSSRRHSRNLRTPSHEPFLHAPQPTHPYPAMDKRERFFHEDVWTTSPEAASRSSIPPRGREMDRQPVAGPSSHVHTPPNAFTSPRALATTRAPEMDSQPVPGPSGHTHTPPAFTSLHVPLPFVTPTNVVVFESAPVRHAPLPVAEREGGVLLPGSRAKSTSEVEERRRVDVIAERLLGAGAGAAVASAAAGVLWYLT